MPSRVWKILPAIAVMVLSTGAHGQNYQELSAMVTGPWHHVPDVRSTLEFNREFAKCQVIAAQTPVNSTTTAVVEIVRWRVAINCLKASGYEPGEAPTPRTASTPAKKSRAEVKMAGNGPGAQSCSQYNSTRATDEENYLSWATGFMTGWNFKSKSDEMVELSGLTFAQQIQFLRDFCEANPTKRYLEGVTALMSKLRTIKKN
jgi:hypothetical protein